MNAFELDLLEKSFLLLRKELGDAIKWRKRSLSKVHSIEYDALFELNRKPLYMETKREVIPAQVDPLEEKRNALGNLFIAAGYISPKAKEMLRKKGIHYIDGKGNMFLKVDQVIVYIDGIPNPPPPPHVGTRLFAKAGLQVVFWLLQDRNNANLGYRALAERAQVALGNLPMLFQAMQQEGFLVRMTPHKWSLVDRERLLNLWVQEFRRRLKPTLLLGNFQASQDNFRQKWKALPLQDGAVWGGEPAADLLTQQLTPGSFTLYSNATKPEIMKKYRWAPQPNGNIAVYRKFWKDDPSLDEKAKAMLAYADLVEDGDDRGLEVAKIIHDRYLRQNE